MPALNQHCKLGIYHQNEVYTANLLNKNGQYFSSFAGDFSFTSDFYCAIINTENNNSVLLAGGTYAGYYFNDNSVFNAPKTSTPQPEEPETKIATPPQESQTKFDKLDQCETDCDKCATCKYKEFFYSSNIQISTEPHVEDQTKFDKPEPEQINQPIKETQPKQPKINILDSLTPQFDYVFKNYPQDETLNNLMQNSKFVKINEENNQYSIGAIYENQEIKYLAYAIKSTSNVSAPEEIGEHYQWLPLDKEDPLSEGYYIVFQDAQDLKIIEL